MMDAALKNRYPFRLGTTSFIHPADYVTNVQQLAPCFDEIELLLFESRQLPSTREVEELETLAKSNSLTFNVHLPMDIDLASKSADTRRQSINAIAGAIERMAPLHPTTYTLHISFNRTAQTPSGVESWQERAIDSMARLLTACDIPSRHFSIETLDYSPQWIQPIVEQLDLSVCVDVGHVILFGFDLDRAFDLYATRVTMMHLHGVTNGKDHRSIHHLRPDQQKTIAHFLKDYHESVSLEVFSLKHLIDSMAYLPELIGHHSARAN